MTTPWPVWAWAYWGGAGVIALVALWLLARALWRDKGAKTRRCPGCAYEMTGIPGLKCPECGREAKGEKALFRRRRSRWWITAAAALLVVAAGLGTWPKVERDGWLTVTPTTVLIWMWPEWVPAAPPVAPNMPMNITPLGVVRVAPPNDARQGILERLSQRGLWHWQKRWLGDRCLWTLRNSTDLSDRQDSMRLLTTHLACSPSMRPVVATLLGQAWSRNAPAAAFGPRQAELTMLARLLERLNLSADDEEIVARAWARAPGSGWLRECMALMSDGTLKQEDLDQLTGFAASFPYLMSDAVIERMADADAAQLTEALARKLAISSIRPMSGRERRVCRLLTRIGARGDVTAARIAEDVEPLTPAGLDPKIRPALAALFFLAPSCPDIAMKLRLPLDDTWMGLWSGVLRAEAAGKRPDGAALLHEAMTSGPTTSVRLEAARMVGLLDLGSHRQLVDDLETMVRGQYIFLSQYAALSLAELEPRHDAARVVMARLRASGNADIQQWIKNAETSIREVGWGAGW